MMVVGLGITADVETILAGCLASMLLGGGLPKRLQDTISSAVGLCVVSVGVTGTIQGLMTISGDGFETRDALVTIACMVAGAAFEEWINIEYKPEQLGEWRRSKIPGGQRSGTFTETFVSGSLLFCVGAMAIAGSLEGELNHSHSTLFTEAVMDGVLSIVFTAVPETGAVFSIFPAGIYQGSMTALAGLIKSYLTKLMIVRMSCIGSISIFDPGPNLVLGSKIKIGNLLPAVFLSFLVCLLGFQVQIRI